MILKTTFLSYHHPFLTEETEVLQHEGMCPAYNANERPASLIWFCLTLKKKKNALSLRKTASDDKTQALHFLYITNHVNK